MNNIDAHGVARGQCDVPDCGCLSFAKTEVHGKCVSCQHVPVKHRKLDNSAYQQHAPPPMGMNPQPMPSGSFQNQFSNMQPNPPMQMPYPQPAVNNMPPGQFYDQQPPMSQPAYVPAQMPPLDHTQCPSCGNYFPESLGACTSCHPRPNCMMMCSKPCFMDLNLPKDLQVFKYCSPECRNNDLPRLDREAGISSESS